MDTTPKIAQYHHRSFDSPKITAASSARDVTPSIGDCEVVSVYAEGRSDRVSCRPKVLKRTLIRLTGGAGKNGF